MAGNIVNICFGERVRALRKASRMTQLTLSDKSDLARSYISLLEHGGANPALSAVASIAAALGVDIKALFDTTSTGSSLAKVKLPSKTKPPIIVPFAKDHSCFNPALSHDGKFKVGNKGDERLFKTFEAARLYLLSMKPARWRRPSHTSGVPSRVTEAYRAALLPEYHHLI